MYHFCKLHSLRHQEHLSNSVSHNISVEVEHSFVKFLGNLMINVWDCGGQGSFMKNYFGSQRETIFKNVDIFVYIFDVESMEFRNDLANYVTCLACLKAYSPSAALFCLVHKMDLVPLCDQVETFRQRSTAILRASRGLECNLYATTIWDESLFKVWSDAVKGLLPNVALVEKNLSKFAEQIEADEILIFEKYSLLVIFYCERKIHPDPRRFEKISNIIKQFRSSCNKVLSNINSFEVRNSKFAAYIESFTANTYIMVVTSDPQISAVTTLLNIRSGRKCFEHLEDLGKLSAPVVPSNNASNNNNRSSSSSTSSGGRF